MGLFGKKKQKSLQTRAATEIKAHMDAAGMNMSAESVERFLAEKGDIYRCPKGCKEGIIVLKGQAPPRCPECRGPTTKA